MFPPNKIVLCLLIVFGISFVIYSSRSLNGMHCSVFVNRLDSQSESKVLIVDSFSLALSTSVERAMRTVNLNIQRDGVFKKLQWKIRVFPSEFSQINGKRKGYKFDSIDDSILFAKDESTYVIKLNSNSFDKLHNAVKINTDECGEILMHEYRDGKFYLKYLNTSAIDSLLMLLDGDGEISSAIRRMRKEAGQLNNQCM